MCLRRTVLGVVAIAALTLSGCGSSSGQAASDGSPGHPASGVAIPGFVVRGPGEPSPAVAMFVRVTLDGRPYIFKLDTGAAKTVIAASVARALALPVRGAAITATTFACKTRAQPVGVSNWQLDHVRLPAMTVVSSAMITPRLFGIPFGGLLGPDVLSRFGTATVDFAGKRLILGGKASAGGHSIPVEVERDQGKVIVSVRATIHGKPAGRYVIDTGSPTAAIEARTSARLGLRAMGKNVTAHGATGCATTVTPVRISDWSLAGVKLPTIIAVSSPSSFIDPRDQKRGIVGLVGANALAAFGQVTFDFRHNRMVLGGSGD